MNLLGAREGLLLADRKYCPLDARITNYFKIEFEGAMVCSKKCRAKRK
jgi:hypothetical protein